MYQCHHTAPRSPLTTAVLFLLLSGVTAPRIVQGEFVCEAVVSYRWKPQKGEAPLESRWGVIIAKGETEDAAKVEAKRRVEVERKKALTDCQARHHSVGRCLAIKYGANASSLSLVGFAARKVLEDSLTEECRAESGECLEVVAPESTCIEKAPPPAPSPAAEAGKGEKGKKK